MSQRVLLLLAASLLLTGAFAARPDKPGKPDKPNKKTCVDQVQELGGCWQCQNKNKCKLCWSPPGERGYGVDMKLGTCVACPENCEKCQGNAQVCTRCLPGFGKGTGKSPCVACDAATQIVDPNNKKCVCNKAAGYVKRGKTCVLAATA